MATNTYPTAGSSMHPTWMTTKTAVNQPVASSGGYVPGTYSSSTPYQGPTLPGQDVNSFRTSGIERSGGTTQNISTNNTPVSGGGGGGSPTPAGNPFDSVKAPQGPSQQEIDSAFNPIFDVYNQAERNLNGQMPGLISEAEQQAQVSQGLLGNSRTSAFDLLGQQQNQTYSSQQNQTAQQRQTLQELMQANRQRFGGSSSAGQAAGEIQGREFQRNTYQIGQQAQQAVQAIMQKKQEVERDFQSGLQQLDLNLKKAKSEIQRTFQDKLLEINARRGETEAAKANARMSALQDLRNAAYQINVSKANFAAQLQLQAQQNSSQLDSVASKYLSYGQQGQGAVDQFADNPQSAIPGVQSNGTGQQSMYTGQIAPQKEEQMTGQMSYQPPDLLSGIMGAVNPRQQFSYGQPVFN